MLQKQYTRIIHLIKANVSYLLHTLLRLLNYQHDDLKTVASKKHFSSHLFAVSDLFYLFL